MPSQASEIWAGSDPAETVIINTTDASTKMIADALASDQPELAAMVRWGVQTRRGGLIERDKYLTPSGIYDQMRVAQEAAENDDVVSGVVETTEALAFSRMSVESDDEDEEDIWNQIIDGIDLDSRIREMWKEMFTISQFYVAVWWDVKNFKVSGRSKSGVQRKKEFKNLRVPVSITLLDPLKIVPVGNFMFGQEQLCWIANRSEMMRYDNILSGMEQDETISRLLVGHYESAVAEMQRLGRQGVDVAQLYTLNPDNVYRVTATRPQYKPFADVRLKSIFELLDLKQQLREMDRAYLLGATNFIVLIRKGSDHMPAKNEELQALQNQVRVLSRIPVIVGDHRLEIEIVTPKIDMVLTPEKYNTLDARITARLYKMFMTGNYAAGAKGDDSMKLIRIVARGMESTRAQLRRSIEDRILMEVYKRNEQLIEEPCLQFHPKSIGIDFDPGLAAFFLDLLDRQGIPVSTVLEQIDLDFDEEVKKMQRERTNFPDFVPPLTPIQDPEQTHEFQMELEKLTETNAEKLANLQHKNQLETLDKEQVVNKAVGVPAKKGTPTATNPGGATPKKATTPVKKAPSNADPKSAGRSGGGNRKGGGAAPGTGQGQAPDARRKAKG